MLRTSALPLLETLQGDSQPCSSYDLFFVSLVDTEPAQSALYCKSSAAPTVREPGWGILCSTSLPLK